MCTKPLKPLAHGKCASTRFVVLAILVSVVWVVEEQHEIADVMDWSARNLGYVPLIQWFLYNEQISIFSSLAFCTYYMACEIIVMK